MSYFKIRAILVKNGEIHVFCLKIWISCKKSLYRNFQVSTDGTLGKKMLNRRQLNTQWKTVGDVNTKSYILSREYDERDKKYNGPLLCLVLRELYADYLHVSNNNVKVFGEVM